MTSISVLLLLAFSGQVRGSVNSIAKINNLPRMHDSLLAEINHEIGRQKVKVAFLQQVIKEVEEEPYRPQHELSHPVDQFIAMVYNYGRWNYVTDFFRDDLQESPWLGKLLDEIKSNSVQIEDIKTALVGLFDLQALYGFSDQDLVSGNILGVGSQRFFGAYELYIIGNISLEQEDYKNCSKWSKMALHALDFSENWARNLLDLLLDNLVTCEFGNEQFNSALNYAYRILDLGGNSADHIESDIKMIIDDMQFNQDYPQISDDERNAVYSKLCPDESHINPSGRCYLRSEGWRLTFSPAKVEVMSEFPRIELWHHFIDDYTHQYIMEKATSAEMKKSDVLGHDANIRISDILWIEYHQDPLLKSFLRTIEQTSGIPVDGFSELLQIASYGIGGFYKPHIDTMTVGDDIETARFATIMLYLSDVQKGGATIFTDLGIRVAPARGQLLFWENTDKLGRGNPYTHHAACPVAIGQKWAANLWVHFSQIYPSN